MNKQEVVDKSVYLWNEGGFDCSCIRSQQVNTVGLIKVKKRKLIWQCSACSKWNPLPQDIIDDQISRGYWLIDEIGIPVRQKRQRGNKMTIKRGYYGGKKGFDYICFNNQGKIECSGRLKTMLAYARKFNWAVAKLIPIRFSRPIGERK